MSVSDAPFGGMGSSTETIILYDPSNLDSSLAAALYARTWGRRKICLVPFPLNPHIYITGSHAILLGVQLSAYQLEEVHHIDLWSTERAATAAYLSALPAELVERIEVHGNERRTLTFATRAHLYLAKPPRAWFLEFEESMGAARVEEAREYCLMKKITII